MSATDEPRQPIYDSESVSRRQALEERLITLIEEVSKCDERIVQVEATRAKYQKLAEIAPDDPTLPNEVQGLSADLDHLFSNRSHLVQERQAVRLEIQELTSRARITPPEAEGTRVDLQAKLEALAKLRKRSGISTSTHHGPTELDFPAMEAVEPAEMKAKPATVPDKAGLIRVRHPNRDFFLADMFDYALKDDGASMEAPIFTLSTKADLSVWRWVSKDGNRSVKVAPSVLGRATQHDKDVLIYVVSQLTEALNRGREDAKNRVVRFTVYDFLVTTNRGVGGDDYKRLQEAFERLAGTRISTDIKTGGRRVKEGFGIIDRWKIIEKSPDDERMIAVEITLSEWLYNAVQAHEVLTIHPDYFRLRKPIARRMYELARKHCGHQTQWQIGLELLHEKSGSRGSIYEIHEALKAIAIEDSLPEYRMSVSKASRVSEVKVTFYTRDTKRLAHAILAKREQ